MKHAMGGLKPQAISSCPFEVPRFLQHQKAVVVGISATPKAVVVEMGPCKGF